MSDRKKTFWVLIIIIIYVVIAIIGFFTVYFIKTINKPAVITSQIKASPTHVPTGFKTYENKDPNFSISYPSDLKSKEISHGLGINTIELRSKENQNTDFAPEIQILTVPKIMAKAIGQDFDTLYNMRDNSTTEIKSPLKDSSSDEKFTKIRNREIRSNRAVEYRSLPAKNPENEEAELGVFIEVGDKIVIIAGSESEKDILETVLQTFTVTN